MKLKLRRLFDGTPAHPPFVPSPDPQCTAPTKSGKPCKLPPLPGTDRCTLPAHKRM